MTIKKSPLYKINRGSEERPRVQSECLRLLATLQLDPARTKMISGTVEPELQERIRQLSLTQLEDLAEALLHFSNVEDLIAWLNKEQG